MPRAIDDSELSETRVFQRDYWEGPNQALQRARGPVSGTGKAQPQPWMTYRVGRSGFQLQTVMSRPRKQVRAELSIVADRAKDYFGLLKAEKDQIEKELGYPLKWEELPGRHETRVSCAASARMAGQAAQRPVPGLLAAGAGARSGPGIGGCALGGFSCAEHP
jgi:hypothetical protein